MCVHVCAYTCISAAMLAAHVVRQDNCRGGIVGWMHAFSLKVFLSSQRWHKIGFNFRQNATKRSTRRFSFEKPLCVDHLTNISFQMCLCTVANIVNFNRRVIFINITISCINFKFVTLLA